MAQLYATYVIGSMTAAYLSNAIYNYSNSGGEKIEKNVISFNHIEEVMDNKPQIYDKDNEGNSEETNSGNSEETNSGNSSEETYNCITCHKNWTLHHFSKNQQKKKPLNMWKCKTCTKSCS